MILMSNDKWVDKIFGIMCRRQAIWYLPDIVHYTMTGNNELNIIGDKFYELRRQVYVDKLLVDKLLCIILSIVWYKLLVDNK